MPFRRLSISAKILVVVLHHGITGGFAMICQRCGKPAVLHITEVLAADKYEEAHLCEECAKQFYYSSSTKKNAKKPSSVDPSSKICKVCGMKFVEFRNTGRLGCPHDYDDFREELVPLLESIHGEARHSGKSPRRLPQNKAGLQELTVLRRKLQQAIQDEAYETAAELRDRIRRLEEEQ